MRISVSSMFGQSVQSRMLQTMGVLLLSICLPTVTAVPHIVMKCALYLPNRFLFLQRRTHLHGNNDPRGSSIRSCYKFHTKSNGCLSPCWLSPLISTDRHMEESMTMVRATCWVTCLGACTSWCSATMGAEYWASSFRSLVAFLLPQQSPTWTMQLSLLALQAETLN